MTTWSLSSSLTSVAGYRMTICTLKGKNYLLRRIRGEVDPLHAEAQQLQSRMQDLALRLIQQLHWADFEVLIDLVFARNGWRRVGVLGELQKDVDLIVEQPITGQRAWVQVKSGTSQAELDDYLRRFERDGSCDLFFFACHTATKSLQLPVTQNLHLWVGADLARAAIAAGLFDWLVARTR